MSANKSWTPTRYQGLYKHANGTFYVRVGTRTWRSLRTKVQSVALKKRDEVLIKAEKELAQAPSAIKLDGTLVSDVIKVRRWQLLNDPSNKVSTKNFWNDIIQSLLKSWPGLDERDMRKIKIEECEEWAGRQSKESAASSFNAMLSALKKLFEIGIEGGIITHNPAAKIKRAKPLEKDLLSGLPSRDEFKEFVELVRSSKSRWNAASGDLVEFLSYSGVRIGEAREICWKHIDWNRNELVVIGDPENDGTKNRLTRRVPIIDDLHNLLKRIQENSPQTGKEDKVLLVKSAKVAMRKAADKIGMERITHHDLRHLFATTCIESGVDIPTVSKWLGHRDGGALAMRVYGHLRNEHSMSEAKKVSFS